MLNSNQKRNRKKQQISENNIFQKTDLENNRFHKTTYFKRQISKTTD